ncbi:DUF4198 domain-containing protein [Terasakiella pusilla]|uniref:DUF4198 domain-containing protein n=1 Tax=Terasakiella pusilla TaxID=64973 RepID=UPI003AA86B7C
MKFSRHLKSLSLTLGVVAAFAGATSASAHEVVIVPEKVENGTLAFSVESTHVYAKPEEAETPANVDTYLLTGADQRKDIALALDGLSLKGKVDAPESWGWLVAHRLGQIWSNTPEGMKEGTRADYPDAVFANRYEKFVKHFVGTSTQGASFDKPLNHTLEIVPLDSPSDIRVGEDLRVQVLHEGRPIATQVLATYAGFTDTPSSYAYATETYGDESAQGMAKVRISAPGLWFVRVEHNPQSKVDGVDRDVLRSILSFNVEK